jgi:uroporphyrinogen decarboxylase
LRILQAAQDLWLNVLHLHGTNVMFDLLADYPVQIINWHDRETWPALSEAQDLFTGAVCGGLQRWDVVVRGTPEQVQEQARDAIEQTAGRRFVLGTGCVTPVVAPDSNIRAVRQVVDN